MSGLEVRVVSGALAGQSVVFPRAPVIVGREPTCDLQLDPQGDLQVSGRHAIFSRRGDGWSVRDLGSRNGTFVNGSLIEVEQVVTESDVIRLGPDGPKLCVRDLKAAPIIQPSETRPSAPRVEPVPAEVLTQPETSAPSGPSTRVWKTLSLVLVAALVLVVANSLARDRRTRSEQAAGQAGLVAQIDAILARTEDRDSAQDSQLTGLADSLQAARDLIQELRREVVSAQTPREDLSDRVAAATRRLEEGERATRDAWTDIRSRSEASIARIFVEHADGRIEAGTAFLVGSDGLMATSAHLLTGPDGSETPRRVAVQFSGQTSIPSAELVRVSERADLALVRVERVPAGLSPLTLNPRLDTVKAEQPMAMMGFPLQAEVLISASGTPIPPTVVAALGMIRTLQGGHLEMSGFGERGASGSPVVDARGEVLGLLRGAITRDGDRILLAVPSTAVQELLGG